MRSSLIPFAIVASTVALVGCWRDKPEVDLTRISVGMPKEDVIRALGKPTRVAVQGGVEYLEYEAYDNSGWDNIGKRNYRWLFVRIVNGKADAFGRKGDFNTTKNTTVDFNVKQQIDTKVTPGTPAAQGAAPFDLKSELEKLQKMKEGGLITEAEYQQLRQRALDKAKAQ
ncbi:MAG: SHOCT domain-containing protein [Holophagaceae bacterium]|nr:SHOCT domain-containing protein [Holophagaceae bacterium]